MKRFAFILILPLAFACKTQKMTAEETVEEVMNPNDGSIEVSTNAEEASTDSNSKPQKPYRVKAKIAELAKKTDYYTIKSVALEGTLLFMTVEYSGGCARHTFEFVGSPAVSKSLPPQRGVMLIHDNGGDQCESIVSRDIEIDISELAYKQESGSEIILNLEGYDEPLKFVYP
ncbi:MAG: hypothetical protein NXI10_13435 [bacterium]|nr:hypothetical protein [bacterium]